MKQNKFKNLLRLLFLCIPIISSSQITKERIQNLLEEIIEINSYTHFGKTKELLSFLEKNNFTKLPNQDEGLAYSKIYPDKELDYTIIIGKKEIEFVLIQNTEIYWDRYDVKNIYNSLKSTMGLPPKTYKEAYQRLNEQSKKPSSTFTVNYISSREFRVVNNIGETRYQLSKFTDIFNKNKEPNFYESYFEYSFLYIYPENDYAMFNLNFGSLKNENGKFNVWFSTPIKQPNLSPDVQIISNKI